MTIEQARKAVDLRKRLDQVDRSLSAKPSDKPLLNLWFPPISKDTGGNWTNVPIRPAEMEALMTARHNRLKAERLLILAEAAELGIEIEDEPQSLARGEEA